MVRTLLNDKLWEKFKRALKYVGCRISRSTRPTVEGILWYLRTGSPWWELPREFGKWDSVYSRFSEWSKSGKLLKVFRELRQDPDFEWISMDSTSVKVHQHALTGPGDDRSCISSSRGGKNTKIHAVVDAHGNPVELCLSSGSEHDMIKAPELVRCCTQAEAVLADKAYDANSLRSQIEKQHAVAVIPLKKTESKNSILIATSTKRDIKWKTSSNG
jgi:transposase